jgi:NitT/TauT family transport system substrate-binding protein
MPFRASPRLAAMLLTLSLLVAAACVPTAAPPKAPDPVKLAITARLSNAPIFIAQEEGYFTAQGLAVEFVKAARSSEALPSLVKGDLDVVLAAPNVGLLNAIGREGGVRIVSDLGYLAPDGCAHSGLVARKALVDGGALNGPADLRGMRIAASRATLEEYTIETLLASANLKIADVTFVDLPEAATVAAMQDGSVDLVYTTEPFLTQLLQKSGGTLWKPAREVIPGGQQGVILFGPNLVDRDQDRGKRFITAFLQGVRQYHQGKTARNVEILAKHTELEPAFLEQACWPPLRADGRIDVQVVLGFQAWAVQRGLLDKALAANDFWDPRFVDHANGVLSATEQ